MGEASEPGWCGSRIQGRSFPVDAVPAPVVGRGFAGSSAPPGMITARGPV